ncbi:MAG: FtsX-like permease family protein, partial [Bacteroidota bacterium]
MTFDIAGGLLKAPGQNNIASTVAPKIYIPMRFLNQTDLIKRGSRVTHRYYFLLKESIDADELIEGLKERLRKEDYGWATVASRKESLGDAFSLLTSFLNLVAFVALLLGCVGVASAVQIYTREKLPSVAVLRCLGASGRMAFQIYLIQVFMMGLLGSIIGATLGSMIQVLIPQVLKDFLPLEVSYSVSWLAVGQGMVTGVAIAVLFALVPLLGIRRISPLRTLRASYEEGSSVRDPLSWLVYLLIFAFVYGFSYLQIGSYWDAFYFSAFLLFSFFLLAGVARALMWLVRKYFPVAWSYVWRQGLANLFRPNNQTLILILTIGLGTALISTLYFIQDILLRQVTLSDRNNQPNMVLFDIQSDQKEEVAKFTKGSGLPIIQELPIVAMRLAEFKGRSRTELLEDTVDRLPRDVLNREYRVSYRDTLDINETLVKGKLGAPVKSPQDSIFVSVSDNHARRMKAKVGDEVIFNVQGALVKTYIGSIRKLDLTQFRTSFTFLFPSGVLETAPQFHVLITRAPDEEASATFQSRIIEDFPNVSVVDISL